VISGCVCLYGCSAGIDQSGHGAAHPMARGIDSDCDDYEDDQEILEDSETSDDSDPELASPHLIRQTNLSMFTSSSDAIVLALWQS